MSDFLRDLVGRTLGVPDVVRPRLATVFEPDAIAASPPPVGALELEAAREASPPPPLAQTRAPAARPEIAPRAEEPPAQLPGPEPAERSSRSSLLPPARPEREPRASTLLPGADVAEPLVPSPRSDAAPQALEPSRSSSLRGPESRTARTTSPTDTSSPPPAPSTTPAATEPGQPAPARAQPLETRVMGRSADSPRGQSDPSFASRQRALAADRPAVAEPAASEPVVHVHIGRIEVRAPAAPERPRAPRPREPLLSLDDYLEQRAPRRR